MTAGRPSPYSLELAQQICDLVAEGLSDGQISKLPGMPCRATINNWKRDFPEFLDKYAQSKEDCADKQVQEILEIADEMPPSTERGFDSAFVNWQRLRVDARKWTAAKLRPKKYGEKLDLTSDGEKLAFPSIIQVKLLGEQNGCTGDRAATNDD